jgi:hypothetical protein
MKVLHGDVWKRRGVSLLWGGQTLSVLTEPQSVVSIRQFFALQSNWPDELPCNAGKTLVVAGLEGCIDILKPSEAESWLESDLRPAIFDFQAEYDLEAALVADRQEPGTHESGNRGLLLDVLRTAQQPKA